MGYALSELYSKKSIMTFQNYDDAVAWLNGKARERNYGIYRAWPQNGGECFDVGPRVFFLEKVDE